MIRHFLNIRDTNLKKTHWERNLEKMESPRSYISKYKDYKFNSEFTYDMLEGALKFMNDKKARIK